MATNVNFSLSGVQVVQFSCILANAFGGMCDSAMAGERKHPKTKSEECTVEDPEVKDGDRDDDEDNKLEFAADRSVIVDEL